MIEHARGLTPPALDQIAALEQRSLAVDGGRLKLEWHILRRRPTDVVTDLLAWEGDRLVGFLGLYAFGGTPVELAGMVDPAFRRRGIGTGLLDAAVGVSHDAAWRRSCSSARASPITVSGSRRPARDARALRARRCCSDRHRPRERVTPPSPCARPVARTCPPSTAFSPPPSVTVPAAMNEKVDGTDVVERAGEVVGTLRTERDGARASVYGFAVDPACQGQGIGRDALRRTCQELRADGADEVRLEVAVENDHALGLYTSLGFERVATEDYWTLPA